MYNKLITNPFFVNNAHLLYNNSLQVLGSQLTRKIIKSTIYKKYCSGENIKELNSTIKKLQHKNINSIIDYACEGKKNEKEFNVVYRNIINMLDLIETNNYIVPTYIAIKLSSLFREEFLTSYDTHFINNTFNKYYNNYSYDGTISLYGLNEDQKSIVMIQNIVERAHENGFRIMIDAEYTKIQPAIDLITFNLQKKYNSLHTPVVSNTYQCYLKGMNYKINKDIDWCIRNKKVFAMKVCRGAYLSLENKELVHNSIEDTHYEFDLAVENIIKRKALNNFKTEIMIASHNQKSITNAINLLKTHNIGPKDGIYFAQLFGMADDLTEYIIKNGYNTYKYLPYGSIDNTIPYLIRRLQENRIKRI